MCKKISISVIMAHFRREEQLYRTLWGYRHQHDPEELEDVEFIIVDDGGNRSATFWKVAEFHGFHLKITAASMDEKTKNASLPMNLGIKMATGDLVVLTNPENIPYTPHLLTKIRERLEHSPNCYLSCGCYSLDRESTAPFALIDWTSVDSIKALKRIKFEPKMGTRGSIGWYNHSRYRPAHLYFLTAMHRHKLLELGGFDEEYAKGQAFEDSDLVMRIRKAGMKIVPADDIVCIHQYHYNFVPNLSRERFKDVARNQKTFRARKLSKSFKANEGLTWGCPKGQVWVKR